MKVLAVFACVLAAAAAFPPALIRTPQFDSAVITHERLGGNFAYKSVEAPAYAQISPIVQNIPTPIGETYHAKPIIAPVTYTTPAETHIVSAAVPVPAPLPYAYGHGFGYGYGLKPYY